MRTNYNVTGKERKALVKAIETYLDEKAMYLGLPSYAYQIGDFTVTKDGALEFSDRTDSEIVEGLYETIADAGFTFEGDEEDPEDADEPEQAPIGITVSVPTFKHSGTSLKNLFNLIFTRADLINKSLGTSFRVDQALVDALQDQALCYSTDRVLKTIEELEAAHGSVLDGIQIADGKITFYGPETSDPAFIHAFTVLCGMMSKHAITAHWITAKPNTEENEKYAMRIWLIRMGMKGPDYKEDRAILLDALDGHSAFHTQKDFETWKRRQTEKREALRAAKAAAKEGDEDDLDE